MRIPRTSVRTTWRADRLIEFSIALVALAFLTREIIFALIGAGILLVLASLGLFFHQRLGILRRELQVVERLPKATMFLGDSLEGELTIRNGSRLAAQILSVAPVAEKGLSLKLSSSSNQLLRPGATSSSKFEIVPMLRGRFQISGFTLTFTDARDLFTGEVMYTQAGWIESYPVVRTQAPLTPLRLYGGSPEILRKAPTGMDYAGIRQYAPGDEYHRIEWKATARIRTLMVKEFHPETQATLQILIDAGRTMHQQSYVGTRLDEALAVAQLIAESTVGSETGIGIWIYDDTNIVRSIKPAAAEEQFVSVRKLALTLRAQVRDEESVMRVPAPRTLWRATPNLPHGERVTSFLRSLKLKLGLGYRKMGVYKALAEATRTGSQSFIVLTDLQTNNEALLEAASTGRERTGRIVVAQIGAPWRLSDILEEAYLEYLDNSRTRRALQHLGLTVFDVRPERLSETIALHVSKGVAAVQP